MNPSARAMSSRVGPAKCGICGFVSASLASLRFHIQTMHARLRVREIGVLLQTARRGAGWIQQRSNSRSLPKMLTYRKTTSRLGPTKCPSCNRPSSSLTGLRHHLQKNHGAMGPRERSLILDQVRLTLGWDPPRRQLEVPT